MRVTWFAIKKDLDRLMEGRERTYAIEMFTLLQELEDLECEHNCFDPINLTDLGKGREFVVLKKMNYEVIVTDNNYTKLIIYELKPVIPGTTKQTATWRITGVFRISADENTGPFVEFFVTSFFDKRAREDDNDYYSIRSIHGQRVIQSLCNYGFHCRQTNYIR